MRRARQDYITSLVKGHSSFNVKLAGLYVDPQMPHLGATPDGLVSCLCCGDGLLEIKCPYSIRDCDPQKVNKVVSIWSTPAMV